MTVRPVGSPLTPLSSSAMHPDVWVIVPAFNEATVIRSVLIDLRSKFVNVVAVDDGSTDTTRDEIRASGARLVSHPRNLGAGAAIQTGIEFALLDPNARYFVLFDADGQHLVSDAVSMIERLQLGEYQILLGSRFLGLACGLGGTRRAVLKGARVFERITTGLRLTDAHNGLRAFTREFASQLQFTHADYAHCSELLELVAHSGLSYAEHPVTVHYSEYSRRKGQRHINSVNIAVDVLLRQALGGGAAR